MKRSLAVFAPVAAAAPWLFGAGAAASLPAQGFGWTPVTSPQNPSARALHAAASDLARQRVVLFGGDDGQTLGDTWLWNGSQWQLAGPAQNPPARRGHAMAYDTVRQRVVLFGGRDAASALLADTWEWDGTTWTQATPATSPSARDGHALAYDPATTSIVLFGGGGTSPATLADTWRWNGTTWTQLQPANAPVARRGHSLAADTVRQRVVLFGGVSSLLGRLGDTWEWNGSDWQPALGVLGGPNPSPRSQHRLAFDATRGSTVLFGGDDGLARGDSWSFDGAQWTQLATSPPNPAPRRDPVLAFDPAQPGLLLFGGSDAARFGDTWSSAPRATVTYGTGCGTPQLRFVPVGAAVPILGHVVAATIEDAPTTVASVMLGTSNQFAGPFPLPLGLDGIGMTGCDLLQSAELVGLGATPVVPGTLSFVLQVPDLAVLVGMRFHGQAFVVAPGQNPLQLVASNGIAWTIGDDQAAVQIGEDFATAARQDVATSGGLWNGGARPGTVGDDGRHGSFDVTLGTALGNGVYEWNTDNFVIPPSVGGSGLGYVVTDGRFYFTDFTLPAGTTLRFTGSAPPQVFVRGAANVAGTIEVRGADLPFYTPTSGPAAGQRVLNYNGVGPTNQINQYPTPDGQPGGAGGAGGGRGGDGARECRGDGDVTQTIGLEVVHIYYGRNGENVKLPAGHAYAGDTAETGGKGAVLRPAAGTFAAASTPLIGLIYRGNFSPGGGGGGFTLPGSTAAITTQPVAAMLGPIQPGGLTLPSLVPVPVGATSLGHFLVGGSGGGGGGSHAYGSLNNAAIGFYTAGAAGTGGGGALALRVGGDLAVAATAVLTARGGDGALITGDNPASAATADANWGALSPGGGGSGGSLLLQAGGSLTYDGSLDVRGGKGSTTGSMSVVALSVGTLAAFNIVSRGGDGSPGFYRLESGQGVPSFTGTAASGTPAYIAGTNGDVLTDRDAVTGSRSLWRGAGFASPPNWLRYELDVDLDGDGTVDVVYTDSGAPGTQLADDPAGPVRIRFQGAVLDPTGTQPLAGTIGPWRDRIGSITGTGIAADAATGFRFELLFDRTNAPNLVVRALRVIALP